MARSSCLSGQRGGRLSSSLTALRSVPMEKLGPSLQTRAPALVDISNHLRIAAPQTAHSHCVTYVSCGQAPRQHAPIGPPQAGLTTCRSEAASWPLPAPPGQPPPAAHCLPASRSQRSSGIPTIEETSLQHPEFPISNAPTPTSTDQPRQPAPIRRRHGHGSQYSANFSSANPVLSVTALRTL
jgi:hypothetical protein